LATPIALRPARAALMYLSDAFRFEEELWAAWDATNSFWQAVKYAWSYQGLSRTRIVGEFVFFVAVDGSVIKYNYQQLSQALRRN
jgi:hypothetical protein